MTTLLTRDEIVRGLMDKGAPREAAEAAADYHLGKRSGPRATIGGYRPGFALAAEAEPPPVALPFILELPWSALVSDDAKYAPASRGEPPRPVIILTATYRAVKEKIATLAQHQAQGRTPLKIPLRLEARVWVPDNHSRRHDVPNFAKCVHDALEKVVYANDHWLYDVRWVRAGVDVDRPRAELTITPIQDTP